MGGPGTMANMPRSGQHSEHKAAQPGARPPAVDEREQARSAAEDQVNQLLDEGATADRLAPAVEELEPADAADHLEDLHPGASARVLHRMEDEAAADALGHMETPLAATVLVDLLEQEPAEAARLLDLMEPDDAADLVQALPKSVAREVMDRVAPHTASDLGKLSGYGPETAGGMMTTDILAVRDSMTIGHAIDYIKRHPFEEEQLDVYVVNDDRRLVGTIGLRDLLVADDTDIVIDHLDPEIDVLGPDRDREDVAEIFKRYEYITMPVVDSDRRILGMVTVDDVLEGIESELSEDPLVQVGAGAGEAAYSTVLDKLKGRSPWLIVNLVAAQIGAFVLLFYHGFIEAMPIVAVVYPVIANQSGNAGQQSLAVTLRGLALGQIRRDRVLRLLVRELIAGAVTGLIVGGTFVLALALLHNWIPEIDWRLGLVAGAAMAIALPVACLVGTSIPLAMERLGFDPAIASTIFLTAVTDFLAYGIFLSLAFLGHEWLIDGG